MVAAKIHLKGWGPRKLSELQRRAKQLGKSPGAYIKRLIQEDLKTARQVAAKSFDEIMGTGRHFDEEEIDRRVEEAKTEYYAALGKKRGTRK